MRRFLGPGQAGKLLSVVFAFVAMVTANIIGARHFSRWDMTENKRYSLSRPTIETLHSLPGTMEVWVLMGPGDPLGESVKQLLVSYRAETDKLDVKYIDPDRDTAKFEDVKRRFHIEAGRTEDGRLVADAVIVVAREDKHWFVTASDLFEVSGTSEGRAKPREEEAVTGAIRNVLGGQKSVLCFSVGHGEMSLDDGTDRGLGQLRTLLEKDNYTVHPVDTTAPGAERVWEGCDVAVVAGPRGPWKKEEAEALRTFAMSGGNVLVGVSPITGDSPTGMQSAGLDSVLSPFGVKLEDALAVERDPKRVIEGEGLGFYAEVRPHAVTSGLLPSEDGQKTTPRVKVKFARALRHSSEPGAASALDLLATTDQAFGVTDVSGAASWSGPPERKGTDVPGPVILAMASERPKLTANAPHGPRMIVMASASFFVGQNWRETLADRGAALFLDSVVSWLAAKPVVLDIPERQSLSLGVKMDEASISDVRRYVLIYMPLAIAILGGTILYLRKKGEGGTKKAKTSGAPAPKDTKKRKKKDASSEASKDKDAES